MITSFTGENNWLSNFYLCEVPLHGKIFVSSEHAYMWHKSSDYEWREFCLDKNNSPGKIKRSSSIVELVDGWETKKIQVMYNVLEAKFTHNLTLNKKLIATGNQNLQEGNWHDDRFWGVDLKVNPNIGENYLGRLLMQLRNVLQIIKPI